LGRNETRSYQERGVPDQCELQTTFFPHTLALRSPLILNKQIVARPSRGQMAGYSTTPLWEKLGYKAGATACLFGAPANYAALLDLPKEIAVQWLPKAQSGMDFVHLFSKEAKALRKLLASCRRQIAQDGVVWVSWPKKSSRVETDLTEDVIRQLALPLGFVDIKVCAIDETWSGLKLMIRKSERKIAAPDRSESLTQRRKGAKLQSN
jgi:hypothetical protein